MAERGQLALTDVEEVEQRIEAYFQSRMRTRYVPVGKVDGEMVYEQEQFMAPPTMAGLALALNTTRQTLLAYSRGDAPRDPAFVPVIARAKARIAEWWEEALATREAATGAQFALRVNHGYGGEDGDKDRGDGFEMKVVPPASEEAIKAIPKWEPEGDTDE